MGYLIWLMTRVIGAFIKPLKRDRLVGERCSCLLITYCGANNTGAEARTKEAITQMRRAAQGKIDFTAIAFDRDKMRRYFAEDETFRIVAPSHTLFVFEIARLVIGSNLVVLIEGSGFRQVFSPVLLWYFLYTLGLAQSLDLPTAVYAADAGKLTKSNQFFARRILEKVDLLMMRCQQAADLLVGWGVRTPIYVNADTAFALKAATANPVSSALEKNGFDAAKPTIGLAFKEFFWWPVRPSIYKFLTGQRQFRFSSIYYHSWDRKRAAKSLSFKRMLAQAADQIAREYQANVIFIAMEDMDAQPCRDVIALMRTPSHLFSADIYDAAAMAAVLQRLAFLVTARYHALVLSLSAGVPFVAISHDERLRYLVEELEMTESYFDYDCLPDHILKERVLAQIGDNWSGAAHISSQLKQAYHVYLQRMNENEKLFAQFYERHFNLPGASMPTEPPLERVERAVKQNA